MEVGTYKELECIPRERKLHPGEVGRVTSTLKVTFKV